MKIEELEKKVQKLEKDMKTKLPRYIKGIVAQDAVADISHRVITTQRKAKGGQFSRYSTKPMLTTGVYLGNAKVRRKIAGSKAQRRQLDWVTIKRKGKNIRLFELKGGYKQFRDLYRGSDFSPSRKSFELTGEMWDQFGLKSSVQKPGELVMVLGGTKPKAQQKMDRNSARERTNIVDISQKELEHLARLIETEMQKYVNQQGLQ